MMKRSKKGFTMVELIICCAILAMLAGACTALFMSGEKLFSSGTKSAISQMDVSLLQTTLLNRLPSVNHVELIEGELTENGCNNVTELLFSADENGKEVFTIRYDGKDVTIAEIENFTCYLNAIGTSSTARAQFSYTVTCKDGTTYSGGMALSTMNFTKATSAFAWITNANSPLDLSVLPEGATGIRFYFANPTDNEFTTES